VFQRVKTLTMATWLTLIIGGSVLVAGLCGQCFGIRLGKSNPAHPDDKHIAKIVITIGSTVVAAWIVIFSAVHLLHLHTVGHW
jgi:hypothetical protein